MQGQKANIPHAREQLHQTSIRKGKPDQNIRLGNSPHFHLNQSQNERAQRKGAQSQGRRVGDLAILDGAIETRLELAPKGWETGLRGLELGHWVGIVDVGRLTSLMMGEGRRGGADLVDIELSIGVGGGCGVRHDEWLDLDLLRFVQ